MRRLPIALFAALLLAAIQGHAQDAQKPLTNSDVIKLSKAGLADNVIILSIERSRTAFDTSPQALIDLKTAGISQPVLEAMLKASAAPAPTASNISKDAGKPALPPPTAGAAVSGKWRVDENHSPMDDSNTVVLSLDAEERIRGPVADRLPTLIIRCKERKTDLYIWTGMGASVEYGSDSHSVRYRLDGDAAQKDQWGESGSNDALFSTHGRELAERLLLANKFVFEFTPFDHPPVVAAFDVRGLGAILPRVARACGWAGNASAATSGPSETLNISSGPSTPEGRSLLDKVVAGLGGEQVISKITAFRIRSSMHSKTPYGEITQDIDIITALPDRRLMTATGGGVTVKQIVNPSKAAATINGKPLPQSPTAHEDLSAEIRSGFIFIAQHANDGQYSFVINGSETIGSIAAQILDISGNGLQCRWYVDPATGHVLRRKQLARNEQGVLFVRTADYSDWRTTAGVTLPFTTTGSGGPVSAEDHVREVIINPAFDPSLFEVKD